MNHSQQQTTTLSFQEAILATQTLIGKMSHNELQEAEIERAIAALVGTKVGARGFFVPYLTGDSSLADNPSSGVIKALKTAPEVVSELLVKNLAMSSAMAVTHQRNQNCEQAKGSERVARRSANLIRQMDLDLVKTELTKLEKTIAGEAENYRSFLKRWGYDAEQKLAIQKAIKESKK